MEGYLVTRAHGLKTRLLTRKDYEALIREEKELTDFEAYRDIDEKASIDQKIEKIFNVFSERLELLCSVAEEYRDVICLYADKLEIENVKFKLREIYGKRTKPYFYPYFHHITMDALRGAISEGEVWDILGSTPYMRGREQPKFITGTVDEREAFLDSLYYEYARNVVLSLKRKYRDAILEAIDREALITLIYWSIIFKSTLEDLAKRSLISGLVPVSFPIRNFDPLRLVRRIGVSFNVVKKHLETNDISSLMLILENENEKYYVRLSRIFFTELPYLIYYVNLALNEAFNLERIILGKILGIAEEEILSYIIV